MPRSVMQDAREREEASPRTVALLHRIGVPRAIGGELLIQSAHAVVLHPRGVLRQHAALFRVEHEHQAHDGGEQPAVHFLRRFSERIPEYVAVCRIVSSLNPAQQHVQPIEYLLRELRGYVVLVFPRFSQEVPESLAARARAREAPPAQQLRHGQEHRAP
ncbi:MAG: hypothetical protein ACK5ZR_01465 [Gemmatimonadaceae bacterium]